MTMEGHDVALQAKEQAAQATDMIKSTASSRVKDQLDTRSSQVAGQITPYAEALRKAGNHLETQGSTSGGQAAAKLAEQIQEFSDYLRRSNADRFISDVESFARRRPWAAAGIGAAIGFMGARFLKASSETRYSTTQHPLTTGAMPTEEMPLTRATSETTAGGW